VSLAFGLGPIFVKIHKEKLSLEHLEEKENFENFEVAATKNFAEGKGNL